MRPLAQSAPAASGDDHRITPCAVVVVIRRNCGGLADWASGPRGLSAYGSDPEYHSAGGYACCQVLERVVQHTGSWDNEALRENLLKMEFDTVMGKLRFANDGLPLATMQLCQWQNGTLEIVYPESAMTRDAIIL